MAVGKASKRYNCQRASEEAAQAFLANPVHDRFFSLDLDKTKMTARDACGWIDNFQSVVHREPPDRVSRFPIPLFAVFATKLTQDETDALVKLGASVFNRSLTENAHCQNEFELLEQLRKLRSEAQSVDVVQSTAIQPPPLDASLRDWVNTSIGDVSDQDFLDSISLMG